MQKTIESPSILRTWSARDIPKGSRVLVRVDANVVVKRGIADVSASGRIARSVPEIQKLLKRDARVILVTHFGRPTGHEKKFSVAPLAKAYATLLGVKVIVADDVVGKDAIEKSAAMEPGDVVMLENVRFDDGEEANSATFAKKLAALAEVYVNNAFGVCHRAHASVVAITKYLPSFAGELLVREVAELTRPIERPFVLVVGGIKMETKLPLLQKLGSIADEVLVGSATVDEFAHHPKLRATIKNLLGDRLVLPLDVRRDADHHAFDVGPKTITMLSSFFADARTIIWNGPFGVIEHVAGRRGTTALIRALAATKSVRIVAGGGETADIIEDLHATDDFTWVSTGGGAMLALLAGEKLPGIEVLRT